MQMLNNSTTMSINESQDKLIAEFAPYEDWFEKYEHLVKLGEQLPAMEEELKCEDNTVPGCQSMLWMAAEKENGHLLYYADSDAKITRGIIAAVLKVVNQQAPEDILNADFYFLEDIGFTYNLSPSRTNGLSAIMKKVKALAREASGC